MTVYEIREADILHNIALAQRRAGVPVWGVVKYDGYGVGLTEMAGLLRRQGVTRLAVSGAEEAHALRRAGFQAEDILLLSPQGTLREMRMALSDGAIFSVGSEDYARTLAALARELGCTARAHIAVDTGMGRFGFLPDDYAAIAGLYRRRDTLCVEGVYSHFAAACSDRQSTKRQFARFTALLERLRADGIDRGMAHIANSPGLFRYSGMALDAVRIGSALVGRVAGTSPAQTGLRPVGTLVTTVCAVRALPKGSRVGYHGEATLRRDGAIAILAAGRRQGAPCVSRRDRLLRRFPTAQIGGQTVRLIATQSESHAIADVTGLQVVTGGCARIDVNPLRVDGGVRREYL